MARLLLVQVSSHVISAHGAVQLLPQPILQTLNMKLMGAVQAINFLILLKSGQADRAGFLVALSFTNIHLQVLDDFLHSLTVAAFVDIEDAKHDE